MRCSEVPCVQPRCYGGSWPPGHPARSPVRRQTVWRWPRQSPHCRCSRPRASRDRLRRRKHKFGRAAREGGRFSMWLHVALTPLSVPAVVAPAVVKVAETAVPGESVHDASRADGVHERSLPVCCDHNHYSQTQLQKSIFLILQPLLLSDCVLLRLDLPLRRLLWVDSCRALSGQFQRSHANWYLHSSMPLCAPAATLLE